MGEGCGGGQRKRLGRRAEAPGPRAAVRTLAASLAGRVLSQGDLLFEHHSAACGFVVGGGGEVPGTLRDPHGMAPSMSVLDGSFWLLCLAPPSPTPACRAGPTCCLFVRPGLGPEAAARKVVPGQILGGLPRKGRGARLERVASKMGSPPLCVVHPEGICSGPGQTELETQGFSGVCWARGSHLL